MLATPAPDLALLGTHISAPACGHGPRITHHASSIKHQASRFTLAYAQMYQHAAEPCAQAGQGSRLLALPLYLPEVLTHHAPGHLSPVMHSLWHKVLATVLKVHYISSGSCEIYMSRMRF